VDLAVVTAGDKTGIGWVSGSGNIGIENVEGKIVISQNEVAAGYGSKFKAPQGRKSLDELGEINGSLALFFDTPVQPIPFLDKIFKPYQTVNPENPYLKSYGW
jgi:hypothetical protein